MSTGLHLSFKCVCRIVGSSSEYKIDGKVCVCVCVCVYVCVCVCVCVCVVFITSGIEKMTV